MAITVVQTKTGYTAANDPSLDFDSDVAAAGNHVIAAIGIANSSTDVGTMGGDAVGSGSYTQRAVITTSYHASIHSAEVAGTPGNTVAFGTTGFVPQGLAALEVSGLDESDIESVSPFTKNWFNGESATKQFRITPAAGEVLLVAVFVGSKTITSFTANGFTELNPGTIQGRMAYRVVTADGTTTYGPDWVCSDAFGVTTGVMVALKAAAAGGPDYTLTVDAGSYTQTGNAVGLLASRLLGVTAGNYALTGNAVGLYHNRVLGISAGSYALTGNAVGLLASRVLGINAGAYVVTGNDVTLTYSGAAGPTYTLTVAGGTYALTGNAVGLLLSRVLPVAQGAYVVTGNAVGLLRQYTLAVAAGSYGITGNPLGLVASRVLPLSSGSYVVTGNDISLTVRVPGAVVRGLWFTR